MTTRRTVLKFGRAGVVALAAAAVAATRPGRAGGQPRVGAIDATPPSFIDPSLRSARVEVENDEGGTTEWRAGMGGDHRSPSDRHDRRSNPMVRS
jgi:hypothetical protein